MITNIKKAIQKTRTVLELGYRITRGIDYQTVSQYILMINQQKDINGILYQVSKCLKEMLDYELFGFALLNGSNVDIWIDPSSCSKAFIDSVAQDFGGQNFGCSLHYFEQESGQEGHNFDAIRIDNLISYTVTDSRHKARLYIVPRRIMLNHHDAVINTIIRSINIALEKNLDMQQLQSAATIDPLTNCYNRRALESFIESDIAFAQRYGTELSVVMLDLDNFKEVNDLHGHQAGDKVLKTISELLVSMVRKSDYTARYGGEEFILVLPDTSLYKAVLLAEKIRKKILELAINTCTTNISVTASFGVASLENKPGMERLFREADERLYKAKLIGKNTVVPSLLPCFADRSFVVKESENKYAASAPAV